MSGTTPQGTRSETEAAAWVRGMFGRVAHRYDLANHLLSFNVDQLWRAHTVRRVRAILERPEARVLDICCGTGDLALALERGSAGPRDGFGFLPSHAGGGARQGGAETCPRGAVRIRRLTPAGARPFARPDYGGVRISQPGELRCRIARDASRAAARRSSGHPGILAAAESRCSAPSTTFIRDVSCR